MSIEHFQALYFRMVDTDLEKLLDRIKPLLEKAMVTSFRLNDASLELTRMCHALLEGKHVQAFIFETYQLEISLLSVIFDSYLYL